MLLLPPATAGAEEPKHAQAALDYTVPDGVARCLDRDAFASAVATRLGYDPFVASGEKTLVVRYERKRAALSANLRVGDAEKSIVSETGACDELGAAAAFAAAILLDPRAMFPKPKPKPPPGESWGTESPGSSPWWEPPPPPPPPPPPVPTPIHFGLQLTGCAGCGPSPNVGGSIFAGIARQRLGIDIGARADLPTSTSAPSGKELSSSLVVGELFPHARFGPARLGLLGSVGALFGEAGGDKLTSFWGAAGVRAAFDWMPASPFFLRFSADGLFVIGRVALRVEGKEVWSSPGFAGGLGIGGGVEF
jgi:hypothetical protein